MKVSFELYQNNLKGILEIKLSNRVARKNIPLIDAAISQHTELEWKRKLTDEPNGDYLSSGTVKVPYQKTEKQEKFYNSPRIVNAANQ